MAPSDTVITVTRNLDGPQVARRNAVLAAARSLAGEGGYDAVTMHAVADRAGVARATVYRYFSGKDHLLAELSAAWVAELVEDFAARPPTSASSPGRVDEVFDRIVGAASAEPRLAEAVVRAALAPDAPLWANAVLEMITAGYFEAVLDDVDEARRHDVGLILGHVLFSAIIGFALHGASAEETRRLLQTATATVVAGG